MCDECKVLKAKLQETVAEAGVYRELLEGWREAYVRQGGIGYWDVLDRTKDALASDPGEKEAAVIESAVEHSKWCGPGGQDIERTLMQRETREVLLAAVAEMEKMEAERA